MAGEVRVGVIGVGYMGSLHIKAFKRSSLSKLVAIYDIDPNRSEEISKQYGVESASSLEELLDKVDAVSIATPTEVHFKIARVVIERGKHLLLEKPITDDIASAEELIRESRKRGIVFQIGHIERYNPAVQELLKLVKRPYRVESERYGFPINRNLDAGVVLDLMIHDIDILLSMLRLSENDVEEIRDISGYRWVIYSGSDDLAEAMFRVSDTVAHLKVSRIHPYKHRVMRVWEREGDKVKLYDLNFIDQSLKIYTYSSDPEAFSLEGAKVTEVPIQKGDLISLEVESFLRSIIERRDPMVKAEDGLRALKATTRIRDSLKTIKLN